MHDPQPDGPSHTLFLAPRPPRQDRPSRAAERDHATQAAVRETAEAWTREQRDAYAEKVAAGFKPDPEPPF